MCTLQAEVLGYVSAHRSISPELLRPLDLHSKRSSSYSMGASCSKSSSVVLSSKANEDLRSSSQSTSSPYLVSNLSLSKSTKAAQATSKALVNTSDFIPARHQADPAGQLQNALAASAATAVLSEASFHAATAVAAGTLTPPPQPSSIAQQSFQEASVVYKRPLDRPAYHHRTASGRKNTGSLITHASFPEALKAVVQQPSQEGFAQLLQHHLFEKQDMKASLTPGLCCMSLQLVACPTAQYLVEDFHWFIPYSSIASLLHCNINSNVLCSAIHYNTKAKT